jgi:hypothetical protein
LETVDEDNIEELVNGVSAATKQMGGKECGDDESEEGENSKHRL